MVTDNKTNSLYLADCLPDKQPKFFQRFEKVLNTFGIRYSFLPNTKDIWAVDFMPIQISKDKFVQFTYNPDYLQPKKYQKTISDVDSICKAINLTTQKSKLIVDGGNVSKTADKVIMCDKIFHENKNLSEKEVIKQLRQLFQVDKIYFIPWDINDFTGHADGMVRFIDNDTVLINDYSKENAEFQRCFRMSLHNAGLDWIELPYNPPNDPKLTSARGLYLNYLQMQQAIIVPTFKTKHDDKALKVLEQVFKGQTFATVESNDLANEGGILNCITWNIQT
ncbi:MAG TPA: agmatine deiminase family protein [Chitinophagaceae bacterium]|nr:agmatine deiminase family protein [Chitinophagaceae bacterium]